jgi:flagellar biosynthetic protein FliQ
MDEGSILDLARLTLTTALMIVAPALLVGMTIGLLVSFFQTITSLQEQTLAIVPKMLAVITVLLFMLPWILGTLQEFALALFSNLADYGKAG